ncbi:hypothetical protein ACFOLK_17875 [Marinococcus halophilus]|uniref:Uncharacterized protein n=2 Tax=Marinococcus halophilus TaxID=1371 RepID=A0A510Y7Q8_MARHA|nr:hypothetical protein [Marinococcus halophilus]GEK59410.1 hypothetical protein MHA01_23150 [Marinococcus halophilus]
MQQFAFAITDNFFPNALEGEIQAEHEEAAKAKIKSMYAQELDTEEKDIEVLTLYKV